MLLILGERRCVTLLGVSPSVGIVRVTFRDLSCQGTTDIDHLCCMDCPFGCVFSYVIVVLRFPADYYAKGSIVDRGGIAFYGVRLMGGVRWWRIWCVVWVFGRLGCLFFCQVDVCCGLGCRSGGIVVWDVLDLRGTWRSGLFLNFVWRGYGLMIGVL